MGLSALVGLIMISRAINDELGMGVETILDRFIMLFFLLYALAFDILFLLA